MIPDFAALTTLCGRQPRPLQAQIVQQVEAALAPGQPVALAVQAGTGTGKSWALAYSALRAAAAGRRVVWSTHTLFQRQQVLSELQPALAQLESPPPLAERRGLADHVSPSRTRRLRHAMEARGAPTATLAQLDRLAARGGLLADALRDEGGLPVPASLLCLTAACPEEEMAAYRAQKQVAQEASIVGQTHAMTLLEARFGRLRADLVIFDEADTLPSVAAGAVEMRLPLADIEALAARAEVDIAAPLAALQARTGAAMQWCDKPMAEVVRALAAALLAPACALRPREPELAEALSDTAAELRDFARHGDAAAGGDARRVGAALVEEAGPTLAVVTVDPARWLGAALKERQVVLLSATLGRHEDTEEVVTEGCRRLGFFDAQPLVVSPERYGQMTFHLADRATPLPFRHSEEEDGEVEPDPAFFAAAAAMVRAAQAKGGRTLVLCASFADVEQMAVHMPHDVLLHRRGERFITLRERFDVTEDALLVTPSAWAGLDVRGGIPNLVIVRLPLGRPDPLRQELLREAMERHGWTGRDARNILANEARGEAMRRLTQGMGRGVRAPDHRCHVWIADPRFPLPASLVAEVWRGVTQGHATGWEGFARAIPRRFRTPGGRSAYDRAEIFAAPTPVPA